MKNLPYIIIFALLGYIMIERGCRRDLPPQEPVVIHTTETVYDSTTIVKVLPAPEPKIIYKEVPIDVDTAAILREHYLLRVYGRTLVDDKDLFVSLTDTVWQNKLFGGEIEYKIRRPMEIINTTTVFPSPPLLNEFYIGTTIGGSVGAFRLSVDATYLTKKKVYYRASYDVLGKGYYVGVGIKVF